MSAKDELKKLQKEWYAKLKADGFVDIEQNDIYENLKVYESYDYAKFTPNEFEEKRRYFQLAEQMLEDYIFKNEKQRNIWKFHTEGLSTWEIGKKMGMAHQSVWEIIDKLSKHIVKP